MQIMIPSLQKVNRPNPGRPRLRLRRGGTCGAPPSTDARPQRALAAARSRNPDAVEDLLSNPKLLSSRFSLSDVYDYLYVATVGAPTDAVLMRVTRASHESGWLLWQDEL
jgi:hypothetical protein